MAIIPIFLFFILLIYFPSLSTLSFLLPRHPHPPCLPHSSSPPSICPPTLSSSAPSAPGRSASMPSIVSQAAFPPARPASTPPLSQSRLHAGHGPRRPLRLPRAAYLRQPPVGPTTVLPAAALAPASALTAGHLGACDGARHPPSASLLAREVNNRKRKEDPRGASFSGSCSSEWLQSAGFMGL